MKIKEDLMEILNDHHYLLVADVKGNDETPDHAYDEPLLALIEERCYALIKEVNELLGSTYS